MVGLGRRGRGRHPVADLDNFRRTELLAFYQRLLHEQVLEERALTPENLSPRLTRTSRFGMVAQVRGHLVI